MKRSLLLGLICCVLSLGSYAQFNAEKPENYILAGLEVEGATYSDANTVIAISGLEIGQAIAVPGIQVSDAIKRLWGEDLYSDVLIKAEKIEGNTIFLVITVQERPRISQFSFEGINKSQADDLREKINFIRGTILTESKRQTAKRIIRNFFVEKGFYNISTDIQESPDKILKNGVEVVIKVNKGKRVKVEEIRVVGNELFTVNKVRRKLKKFHQKTWWRFWARSKYVPKTYEEAKDALLQAYNDAGYRDATIEADTVYAIDDRTVMVEMKLEEGPRYYHGDIVWAGNYKYNAELLGAVLGIKSGDVYNRTRLDSRLFGDPNGSDVSSLYLDNGYLFFDVRPVEVAVRGDTIDLEMRIAEGPQASIRKVPIGGNTKTSDDVVRREIRTAPGQKFSRSDIIRSQREILALGYFDQENLGVQPIPNQQTGTVDIQYTLEERPSDQLQLQGGWGGQIRDQQGNVIAGGFVGTVQLAFNNFSTKRIFDPGAWRPVPSGDGQKLSLSFQMNGTGYKNFSATFQEPWLGGKKPTSLGVSASYIVFRSFGNVSNFSSNRILQTSVDLGRRLKWPDDFFVGRTSIGYKFYDIINPTNRGFNGFAGEDSAFINIITLRQTFSRSSIDAPIFPRSGSSMSLSVEATPPYSLFSNRNADDYSELPGSEKFRFLEYHKWRFNSQWFFRIVDNLVLMTKLEAGYLGAYNPALGVSPFERYFLGGSGLIGAGFAGLDGREILPLRGYANNSLTNQNTGYPIYNRFVMELRYPLSLNQSAPVWVLGFLEGGNGYGSFREYNPLRLRRAAGGGVRVMLPMVGLLGLDWAWGFDTASETNSNISGSQFHFILGQDF